jgi:hypothetical protein
MGERTQALADRFQRAADEFVAAVAGIGDDDWGRVPADGTWSAGKNAEHTASGMVFHQRLVRATVDDQPMRGPSASGAPRPPDLPTASTPKPEVIEQLRSRTADGVALLRGLPDDALDKTAQPLRDGSQPKLQAIIQDMMIAHLAEHQATIQQLIQPS